MGASITEATFISDRMGIFTRHFEWELTNGVPTSARRLETRLLVRNARGVYGVTYRWDDTQTNAAGKFYRVQVLEP